MGDRSLGKAQVERKGLYYHIYVQCDLDGVLMYKVLLRCGNKEENLGILVPQDGGFGLRTRIPIKRIGEGILNFSVRPRHQKVGEHFIPLSPEEPFRYISRLKHAYLVRKNGVSGIVFSKNQ